MDKFGIQLHKMDREIKQEEFNTLIKMFGLKSSYKWISHGEKTFIIECWHSDINPFLIITKTFEFDEDKLSSIPDKKRKDLLEKMLNEAVEIENYEFAAKLRDILVSF